MTRPALALPFILRLVRLPKRFMRLPDAPAPRDAWPGETAWLDAAADLADLEHRLKRLERGRPDRFGPLPP